MKNTVFTVFRKVCSLPKRIVEEFQFRFLGKTGYGDDLLRFRKFRVYHREPPCGCKDPVLYLTLDVEWGGRDAFEQMLDTLKDRQVCAMLFLIGEVMEEKRDLLSRILEEGHCVGNHTMHHPNLTQCTEQEVLKELEECADVFFRLTGQEMPRLLRPPFGRINRPLAKLLCRHGYTVLHWSLHVPDFEEEQPTWEDYETHLNGCLHNGGILLQHSFSSATAENLGRVIDLCREKGYRFAGKEAYAHLLRR